MNLNARIAFPFLTRFLIAILLTICLILLSIYPVFSQCPTLNINAVSITPVTCAGGTTGRVQTSTTGGTGPYTYSWSTGHTSASISNLRAGDYTVTATDANGCPTSKTFTVPEVLAAGPAVTDVPVCKGSTSILTASGAPIGGSYKWYTTAMGGTALPGEISGTFTTPEIRSTTTWYVSKVDASNCETARTPVSAKMLNPLYPFVDLDSALIMHYKFDNNYVDETGRHSAATLAYGSPSAFMKDRHGINRMAAAVEDLSGTGTGPFTYLDFGTSSDLQALTDKVAISVWMRRTVSGSTLAPMINKWQNGSGFYIGTYLDNSSPGARKVLWKIAGTQVISTQDVPNNNSWHHIVCLYTGTELQIYQNGILTGSTPFAGNIPATAVNLMAGRQADGAASSVFTGVLDDLRIYNRALTADEIKTIYNDESVAFNNTPVCAEATINLSTFNVPQATFQWTGPSGFSDAVRNPAIASAAATHGGSYSLQVSKYGCTTPAQKTSVTVNPLPSTTITPSGATTFCDGNNITLSAPSATSWLWSTGATTRTITVSQQRTYSVTVTGSNGCSDTSDPLDVTVTPVNDAPAFTKGVDVVAYEGVPHAVASWATGISPGPAEATQTVNFQVSNDNNALFSIQPSVTASGDLSFTPAQDIAGVATVTIFLKDDGGTTCGVDQSAGQTFTITVNNVNDVPSFVKGTDVEIDEDAGAQAFAGWATGLSAGVGEGGQVLNFVISNDNNSLFTVQPFIDAAGNLSFKPAPDAWGSATVTAFVKDDGGTANGGVDQSATQTFTITVNPVNDAPSFTAGGNIVVAEDAATQIIQGWASAIAVGAGEEVQTLSFIVSGNNPALFTTPPAITPSGDLSFTVDDDVSGIATVTVSLKDDGGTANGGTDQSAASTFTITVNTVNDAPSFIMGNNVVLNEDAQGYHAAWATHISAGDPGQALTFVVSASNAEMFAVQPAITASGTLTFQLKPNVSGSSDITVFLKDDGGTSNGGVDRTTMQTFQIVVTPVNDAPHADAVDNIVVSPNTTAVPVELTDIHPGAGEETQQLSVTAFASDPSIVADIQVTPLLSGSALLTLSLVPGAIGVARITVVIRDNGGTTSGGVDETILSFMVTVESEDQTVFLPNLFSPDGNGTNDAFRVRGVGIAEIRFGVYTADGQELFSTTDVTTATQMGWDGTYKGKPQPSGTYTWVLQGKYTDGQALTNNNTRFGQFILMR